MFLFFFIFLPRKKKMFMGRFKLSKKNLYLVRLENGSKDCEGYITGASNLQELKNMAFARYWARLYYCLDLFPTKMVVIDGNKRRLCYTITLTGNVRTSK